MTSIDLSVPITLQPTFSSVFLYNRYDIRGTVTCIFKDDRTKVWRIVFDEDECIGHLSYLWRMYGYRSPHPDYIYVVALEP